VEELAKFSAINEYHIVSSHQQRWQLKSNTKRALRSKEPQERREASARLLEAPLKVHRIAPEKKEYHKANNCKII
jgi:uncharacterized protein YqeY